MGKRKVDKGRSNQGRPVPQQAREGGVQEDAQERKGAPRQKWMDGSCHEGAQGAWHHRVLPHEPWSSGSGPLQESQGALQLRIIYEGLLVISVAVPLPRDYCLGRK